MPKQSATKLTDSALLARRWRTGKMELFISLSEDLIEAGNQSELTAAYNQVLEASGEENAQEMAFHVLQNAEFMYTMLPDKTFAAVDLFTIPVLCEAGAVLDVEAIGKSLCASGIFLEDVEIRIADGWCELSDVVNLSPCSARGIVNALSADKKPDHISMKSGSPETRGLCVLLGIAIRFSSNEDDDSAILEPDEDIYEDAYLQWQQWMIDGPASSQGLVLDVVRPTPPSLLAAEVMFHIQELSDDDFLADADEDISHQHRTLH